MMGEIVGVRHFAAIGEKPLDAIGSNRRRQNPAEESCHRQEEASEADSTRQQDRHLWLFLAPRPSRYLIVSGHGCTRCTGPFARSIVVCPSRLTAFTSAPLLTRYRIISVSPRAAAW